MANNFFKVKKGIGLEPKTGSTVTVKGDIAVNDTTSKLEYHNGSTADALVTETGTGTLTGKTIDGDDNTVRDLPLTAIKTNLTDASKFIVRDAAGIPVSNTKAVPAGAVVGTTDTQTLTNKTIDGDDNTVQDLALTSLKTVLADANKFVARDASGIVVSTNTVPTGTVVGTTDTQTLTNKTIDADLNTVSNIENADIKAGAAIARNKLASGTANHVVINDGTGVLSSEANLAVSRGGTGTGSLTANNVILGNGTSAVQFVAPGTSGNVLTSNGTTWTSASSSGTASDQSYEISGIGLATSVSANALTIALKQKDGSTDLTAGSPGKIGFRSATVTSGAYNQRVVSSALSVVVSSGSTLGHTNASSQYIYVYALDNAGTVELAVSSKLFSEGSVQSTTAEGGAGAADSATVLYSTTARSNVPIRVLGRLRSTQTTAGTWAAAMTEVSLVPFSTFTTPTIQTVTATGAGTYTRPTSPTPLYLRVRLVGAGGGSSGSGSSGQTAGGTGGTTTFGTSLLSGSGGGGGQVTSTFAGGLGGSASITSPAYGITKRGGDGVGASGNQASGDAGGSGGNSPWSGAGSGRSAGEAAGGANGVANSGSGGGGSAATSAAISGSGGGSGGYVDAIIPNPSETYSYSVGVAGTAGGAGTSGGAGGIGGSGFIVIEEFYQ